MSNISSKNIKRLSVSQSPVVLAILDGWGYRKEKPNNAIKSARTPIMDSLWHAYPHTLISASGSDVGLPDGQMGNSEVGHLTIGSGRIIQQELVRISNIVKNNQLGLVNELKEMAASLKKNNSTLHITGLCSDGGVHSHIDHLLGLIKWASDNEIKKVAFKARFKFGSLNYEFDLDYVKDQQQKYKQIKCSPEPCSSCNT